MVLAVVAFGALIVAFGGLSAGRTAGPSVRWPADYAKKCQITSLSGIKPV
jgi:hypothetical protein